MVTSQNERIGDKFRKEVNDINTARKSLGLPRFSYRELTDRVITHMDWKKIKEDTIKLGLHYE